MVFNSLTFVAFFALVLLMHSLPLGWTTRKVNLLIASYIFYSAWNPPFVILLWISTIVDWYAAQALVKAERPGPRRAWMLLSVVANLGMLAYFKYGKFALQNFAAPYSPSRQGLRRHPCGEPSCRPRHARSSAWFTNPPRLVSKLIEMAPFMAQQ